MKKNLLSILILLITINLLAQNPPKRELRGVWISTHLSLDWPNRLQTPFQQQAAFVGILDHNKTTGMNAAYLQVRSQADAMYASNLEPWSYYLTNNQGTAPSPFDVTAGFVHDNFIVLSAFLVKLRSSAFAGAISSFHGIVGTRAGLL